MLDVVCIEVAFMDTSGETTAAVAGLQCAADRRRNAARFAPHIERFTVLVLEEAEQAGIAGEAAHGLDGDRGSLLDLAASGSALAQSLGVDVVFGEVSVAVRKFSASNASASARRAP